MGRKIESFVGGKDGYKAYENAGAAGTTVRVITCANTS